MKELSDRHAADYNDTRNSIEMARLDLRGLIDKNLDAVQTTFNREIAGLRQRTEAFQQYKNEQEGILRDLLLKLSQRDSDYAA